MFIHLETDLLTTESFQNNVFSLTASSHSPNCPPVGVLGKIGEDRFWSPLKYDHSPFLLVRFQKKRHISVIELRGEGNLKGVYLTFLIIVNQSPFHCAGDIEREDHIPDEVRVLTSDSTPGSEVGRD